MTASIAVAVTGLAVSIVVFAMASINYGLIKKLERTVQQIDEEMDNIR